MRHVVVDATPLGPSPSGARRRLESLLPPLAALLADDLFEVHWARDGGGPTTASWGDNVVHATVGLSCRGGARRWWLRARHLRRRRKEAAYTHLLVDHGPVPVLPGVEIAVTVHDLRFLDGWGGVARRLYGRHAYGRLLRRADAVIAVAPSVARRVMETYGLDPRRVHVAPNAAEGFSPPPPGSARRGVLLVSRDEKRKARGAGVGAARAAGLDVTIVDASLDEEGLRRAYRAAAWLLAPSLEEGYDLPVAEALASGTPVVGSDISAHRDLLDFGAKGLLLVPPPTAPDAWPAATALLREPPPAEVRPPEGTWADAARSVRDALVAS